MNVAYLSTLSALAGSAIGALATFATTWLTQHHQDRSARWAQESAKREQLYGDFVDLASQLFADALSHGFDDPKKIVPLYAIIGRLRLFASMEAVKSADVVMALIIDTYYAPNRDFTSREPPPRGINSTLYASSPRFAVAISTANRQVCPDHGVMLMHIPCPLLVHSKSRHVFLKGCPGGALHSSSYGLIWPREGCASIAYAAIATASYFPPHPAGASHREAK